MYMVHEKRLRRANKARAHKRNLKHPAPPERKFTMRPGAPTVPVYKKTFWQRVVSFFKRWWS